AQRTGANSLCDALLQKVLPMIERLPDVQDKARCYLESGRLLRYPIGVAREQLKKAVQLAHSAGLKAIEAEGLRELGLGFWIMQNNFEQATLHLEHGLQLSREIENRKLEGIICNALALILDANGNDAEAQRYAELGIRLCREVGNRFDEGFGFTHLASSYYHQGAYAAALQYAQQALTLGIETQTYYLISLALLGVGLVLGDLGQYAEALTYYERVLHAARGANNLHMVRTALFFVGLYAHYAGDDARAQACGQEGLRIASALGEQNSQRWGWMITGHALMGLGQLDEANAAYQHALKGWDQTNGIWFRASPVRVALLKGDTIALQEALPHVEEILRRWDAHPGLRDVGIERFESCWACYRLLQALHDPRAPEVLERAYNLVQATAAKLQDPAHRRMFLENVAAHRDIVAEWERIQQDA
ncbi:MAG: tetratricopeptide repeat protein, partial [Anaerolineae bacterium]